MKLETPDIGVYLFRLHTQYILESQIKAFLKRMFASLTRHKSFRRNMIIRICENIFF